ncbi:MAG: tetracyclin repressor, C-terminal all-alpha domain protein [Microbacteriaceae bacterium]|nr:tetracyclin repressor, C-terminal all-alpha domain protein [Microbacteriaceae bacterium]
MGSVEHDDGLTTALRKAWKGNQRRSGLTINAILDAALKIADQEGLASLTFRKLGEALGASAMALYRHVESRDELLLLVFDFALGEPPKHQHARDWRTALEEWATALYRRYESHPALVEIPIRGLPVTPNHSAWIERLLVGSQRSGLDSSQRLEIGLLLDGHVRNIAGLGHTIIADAESERRRASAMLELVAADRFPELRAVLAAGAMQNGEPPGIEFGIRTILNGVDTDRVITVNPPGGGQKA